MKRKPSKKPGTQRRARGWDPLAAWYDGWVGAEGSRHHQQLAIPVIMDLLSPAEGERILDVGCGQGVLAPHLRAAGALYTGIDASPRLVKTARRRHGQPEEFIVGDARALAGVSGLRAAWFDAAVFLLSLQDMDPLDEVLESAAWAVRPGGRLAALMTHPCFRIPRQSGWGFDEGRKLRYRRIDSYLSPLPVPLKAYPGKKGGVSRSYHRPLQMYINGLGKVGFAVVQLVEIPTYKRAKGPGSRSENRANAEIPLFLGLLARRLES